MSAPFENETIEVNVTLTYVMDRADDLKTQVQMVREHIDNLFDAPVSNENETGEVYLQMVQVQRTRAEAEIYGNG